MNQLRDAAIVLAAVFVMCACASYFERGPVSCEKPTQPEEGTSHRPVEVLT